MHRNLTEKLGAKFPATTYGYSVAKIACLDDAFSEIFAQWKGNQVLQQKDKKGRKRKGKKN